jgi:hypothetical protein
VRSDGEENGPEAALVDLFVASCKRFLATEEATLVSLQQHGFTLVDDGWNFTLPQLHEFLVAQSGRGEAPAYLAFRKRLFNSPINIILAESRGEVVIANNVTKVDLTTYRLQRRMK